jgi:hypothetical protein
MDVASSKSEKMVVVEKTYNLQAHSVQHTN